MPAQAKSKPSKTNTPRTASKASKKAPKKSSPTVATRRARTVTEPETKAPRPQELAQTLGVTYTPRLKTKDIRRLLRTLPGYVNVLDDAADQLTEDAEFLNLQDVTPEGLLALKSQRQFLTARESTAALVYRSIYEQRLQVDDRALRMLLKIARRVEALSEDDPHLPERWKSLRDFLAVFRRRAAEAPSTDEPLPDEPSEDPTA